MQSSVETETLWNERTLTDKRLVISERKKITTTRKLIFYVYVSVNEIGRTPHRTDKLENEKEVSLVGYFIDFVVHFFSCVASH